MLFYALKRLCVAVLVALFVSAIAFTALRMSGLPTTRTCHACLSEGHEASARFCKDCGAELPPYAHG